jgi:ABC-type cobalamin/Fe3+-siderophores transport system ATPase subunit
MPASPYRFTGPLDPVKHESICASRNDELTKVISGIKNGDYWSIIGPSQMGKTTLLRQLIHILSDYYYIYIDMESTPDNNKEFYEMLINTIIENVPCEPINANMKKYAGETHFYDFLKILKPKEDKPIIFFFDEIEKAYSVHSFLHLWRRVFHERDFDKNLANYTVIAAGKAELSSLTAGEDADISPFNIAQTLNLKELTKEETERLISNPFSSLGIEIESAAKRKIYSQTKGHPQLLQHLCHLLIENSPGRNRMINEEDVAAAIDRLLFEETNTNIQTLEKDIKTGKISPDLLRKILKGEKIGFLRHRDLSITGTGPIVNEGRYCAIRNNIYAEFLKQVIKTGPCAAPAPNRAEKPGQLPAQEKAVKERGFSTTIYFEEVPPDFASRKRETEFLRKLFKCQNKKIEIINNNKTAILKDLSFKEELIFCYLAYKNYKAINEEGFADWKSIPHTYEYYLSSSTDNNENQEPEWGVFKYALRRIEDIEHLGDNIKAWIFGLRKKLRQIDAADVVFSEPGRGSGYFLKGAVHFYKA